MKIFCIGFFTLPIIISTFGCSNQPKKNNEGDYYYSRGQKIELKKPGDSIGVLLRKTINPDSLETIKTKFKNIGYQYVRQLSHDIVIIVPVKAGQTGKQEMINQAVTLPSKDTQLIEKAGYIAYRADGKYPLIITNEIILEFKKESTNEKINELFKKYGTELIYRLSSQNKQYLLRIKENLNNDAIMASRLFAEDSSVLYAHPNFIMVKEYLSINPLTNKYFPKQWHHQNLGLTADTGGRATLDADIDSELAWDYSTGSRSTVIAIIDEGFDTNHPDLMPNFFYNQAELTGTPGVDDDPCEGAPGDPCFCYIDDVLGWNFRNWCGGTDCGCSVLSTPLNPDYAHGTGVMGMAAATHNDIGVIGSCPDCSSLPLQAGAVTEQDIRAFQYAKARGAKIISCSWQYAEDEVPQGIESAINEAVAVGIVVFFAIPNDQKNECKYPDDIASLDNVISVAASTDRDLFKSNGLGFNSGHGDRMDLLAPGASSFGDNNFNTALIATTDLKGLAGETRSNPPACWPAENPDYYYCWNGTSFATPLAAGVGGLLLSLDPALTPKQVQYLLQDCADKIQPSAATYSPLNGFSRPTGSRSTHGYGRVNAFEAAKIVAPVNNTPNKNGLGGMDIFLRDNYLDWGNTEQPSGTLFEGDPRGFIPFWKSEDIKVDAPPFATGIPSDPVINTNAEFEALPDNNEDITGGTINRVYVRVRNRGYVTVPSVLVKLHWTDACLSFPALPSDFWDNFPGNASDVSVWHPFPVQRTTDLRYCGASVAGRADDDGSQIVMFEFDAPLHDVTRIKNHYCLMALVSSDNDPMPTQELRTNAQRLNMDFVTSHYNNATHRNYVIINPPAPLQPLVEEFYLNNPYPYSITTKIETDNNNGIYFSFADSMMAKEIKLKKGERKRIIININPGQLLKPEELTIRQVLIGKIPADKKVLGGLTYRINPAPKKSEK